VLEFNKTDGRGDDDDDDNDDDDNKTQTQLAMIVSLQTYQHVRIFLTSI
jgi:hypothetical protein